MGITSNNIGSGQTYTTLAGWEAGCDTSTGTNVWKGVIVDSADYDEEIILVTTETINSGAYYWLTVDASNRHAGVFDSAKASIESTGTGHDGIIDIEEDYTHLEWLQITNTSTGFESHITTQAVDCSNVLIDKCILQGGTWNASNSTTGIWMYQSTGTWTVSNCLIYGFSWVGIYAETTTSDAVVFNVDSCHITQNGVKASDASGNLSSYCAGSGSSITWNVYNTIIADWGSGTGGNEWAIGNETGAITYNGSNNIRTGSSAIDTIGGTGADNLTGWVDAASGHDDVTKTSSTWVLVTTWDATGPFTAMDLTLIDDRPENVAQGAGIKRRGSEPDSRQDFSTDLLGNLRPSITTIIDIGPFQITTPVPWVRGLNSNTGSTTAVVTKPTGLADGDWVIGFGYSESDSTPTWSGGAGWTHFYQTNNFCWAGKYLEAGDATGEPATYTLTGIDEVIGAVFAVAAAGDSIFGMDDEGETYDGTGDSTVDIPTLTSVGVDRLSMVAAMTFSGAGTGSFSGWTAGWTEILDPVDGIGVATNQLGAAGATGAVTVTPSDTGNAQLGAHILFAPAIPGPSDQGAWTFAEDFRVAAQSVGTKLGDYDAQFVSHVAIGGTAGDELEFETTGDISFQNASTNEEWLRFDPMGGDSDDFEALILCDGQHPGIMARLDPAVTDSTSTADADGYRTRISVSAGLELDEKTNNTTSNIVTYNTGFGAWQESDTKWVRVRIVGSSIKAKVWNVDQGDTEPGTWQIDETDTTWALGNSGLYSRLTGNSFFVAAYQEIAGTPGSSGAPMPAMRANLVHMLTR